MIIKKQISCLKAWIIFKKLTAHPPKPNILASVETTSSFIQIYMQQENHDTVSHNQPAK